MATTSDRDDGPGLVTQLGGTLWLAGALFVATVCLALSLLWLIDGGDVSRTAIIVLAAAATAAIAISSFADSTWSAWRLDTRELGNATRLLALASILFLVPTVLIGLAESEAEGPSGLAARDLDAACPVEEVPEVAFADAAVGSAAERVASCLVWWDVVRGGEPTAGAVVPRAGVAAYLDRLVRSAGEPLRPAPRGSVPADAINSVHATAIGRIAASGIMGGVAEDRFDPDSPVTRSQLSTLVARAHEHVTGAPLEATGDELFDDIDGNTHQGSIESVAEAGIAVGAEGSFSPDTPITLPQLHTILARALDLWVADHGVALPA